MLLNAKFCPSNYDFLLPVWCLQTFLSIFHSLLETGTAFSLWALAFTYAPLFFIRVRVTYHFVFCVYCFVCPRSVSCDLCLCIVHSWLPLRFSLTFIYYASLGAEVEQTNISDDRNVLHRLWTYNYYMVRVMVFNATFNNSIIFQLYRGGRFYWWRKPLTSRKSLTNLSQILSSTPRSRDSNSQL